MIQIGVFTQDPFIKLVPQSYEGYNRGDMYVPRGTVAVPMQNAIAAAPYMGHLMNVTAYPVTMQIPNANARPTGAIGMVTPQGTVT